METTKIIVRVNNVDIVATCDEQRMVPIKPICKALGIDDESQRQKIEANHILGPTAVLNKVVAADGKEREMFCIPMGYVFGWLLTINPGNVNEASRDGLMKYQAECYHALFRYFTARTEFVEQKQKEIDRQLTIVEEAKEHFKSAKNVLTDAEAKLKKLRTLTLDDYDMERRQLKIEF